MTQFIDASNFNASSISNFNFTFSKVLSVNIDFFETVRNIISVTFLCLFLRFM